MENMTIRNLPDEVHDHLRQQAVSNKRSIQAEARAILGNSYVAKHTGGFGEKLWSRFQSMGVIGDELDLKRDKTLGKTADFFMIVLDTDVLSEVQKPVPNERVMPFLDAQEPGDLCDSSTYSPRVTLFACRGIDRL